jgi:hypothetical protein
MFEINKDNIPEVKEEVSYKLADGTINTVYRAGNWSFETSEEADLEYAESGIYAWIAWYNFLSNNK